MVTFNNMLERIYDGTIGISKEDIQKRFNRVKKIYIVFLMYIALFFKSKKVGAFIAKIIAKEYKRIKKELYVESMDYSQICREIKECCQFPHMIEKNYKFFFDETNNYRVFHIKGGDFNESPVMK